MRTGLALREAVVHTASCGCGATGEPGRRSPGSPAATPPAASGWLLSRAGRKEAALAAARLPSRL